MRLRALHRWSAFVIAIFATAHIANHLSAVASVPAHVEFMRVARHFYREPIIEAVLLACVAFQVVSGSWMLVRGWKSRRGLVPWLQATSGAYLALFTHLGCALYWRFPPAARISRALAASIPIAIGGVLWLMIVLALAGKLHPVEIPEQYKAIYERRGQDPVLVHTQSR